MAEPTHNHTRWRNDDDPWSPCPPSCPTRPGEDVRAEVRATRYEVTAYPFEDLNRELFTLTVEHRGSDRWAVLRGRLCFARNGGASYEPTPSERTDEWLGRHRFTLDEALDLARREAPKLKVNGVGVDEAIRRALGEDGQ